MVTWHSIQMFVCLCVGPVTVPSLNLSHNNETFFTFLTFYEKIVFLLLILIKVFKILWQKNSGQKHRSFFVCFLHQKIVYWSFYILLLSLSLNLIARYQKVQLVVIFVFKSETHFRGHVKMKTYEKEIFLKVILQKPSEKNRLKNCNSKSFKRKLF